MAIGALGTFLALHSSYEATERTAPVILRKPEAPPVTVTPPAPSPHEARLAELRERLAGVEMSISIESAAASDLAKQAMKLSTEPIPDPGDKQFLMDKMDEQKKRVAGLVEEHKRLSEEIEQEKLQPQAQPKEP